MSNFIIFDIFVFNQKPNAIILEPFFGDNLEDCLSFNINTMLRALNNAIVKYKEDV